MSPARLDPGVGPYRDGGLPPSGLMGVVLAGGESRRFGRPKALALFRGEPLWRRAARVLEVLGGPIVALANDPAVAREMGVPVRADLRPGGGPLAGIETGLRWALEEGREGILVLACDLPLVDERLILTLRDHWEGSGIVAFRAPGPWGAEPLCAVYGVDVLPAVVHELETGSGSPGRLLSRVTARTIDPGPVSGGPELRGAFRSANRPGALAEMEALAPPSSARDRHALFPGTGPSMLPPILSVLGNKKSGKTTLVVGLIRELTDRGHRVMSVKHGHHFRLDREGTDSWRHRHEGGARRVVMAGPDEVAVTGEWGTGGEIGLRALVRRFLPDAGLVVAEGFREEISVPRIEIFRSRVHSEPITPPERVDPTLQLAVVTDRPELAWPVPAFDPDRPDLAVRLADLIEARLLTGTGRTGP